MPDELPEGLQVPTEIEITAEEIREDDGPLGWFRPVMESAYAPLVGRAPEAGPPAAEPGAGLPGVGEPGFADLELVTVEAGPETASSLEPDSSMRLVRPDPAAWRDVLREFRRRKGAAVQAAPEMATFDAPGVPGAPAIPGGRNWFALGPAMVLDGQTVGRQPVAGRVSGIAVAPGAAVIYAATANGGVFRSDDGAQSWRSMMDGFDLDPTSFASASLVCGAIALSPADPGRVYVGTGEGATHEMFSRRVTSALPAYRGVGPLRSDDGGASWIAEASAPDLAGYAFFALAVDPADPENVVAATTRGLYQRVPAVGGDFEWVRRRDGVHSSVVVRRSADGVRFHAAAWGGGVVSSADGETWEDAGTGFPTAGVGRIALATREAGGALFALVADTGGGLRGLHRLGAPGGAWQAVGDLPDVLPGRQGDYDLAIAVDPEDCDRVYLGGDRANFSPWPASVWRCELEEQGGAWRVAASRSIGHQAHADVHVLTFTPGDPHELWCGNDGGLFLNRDPRGSGEFAGHNNGLASLCANFLGQHPTDPNVIFTGLQDNGTARTGGALWSRVQGGDGGYCVVNWDDPDLVLVFANGTVHRSTTGGDTLHAWSKAWNFSWATMTQPIVTTPRDPADPAAAGWVAVGAGRQVSISDDFADSWSEGFLLPGAVGNVFALAFASPTRLYVGTTAGRVFRADRAADGTWTADPIDAGPGTPLGVTGLVTDVAVDWADPDRGSVYVTFGGFGDPRRVWHYDGTDWESRSGAPGADLLNVEHNALVVDPEAPENLYAGANIGVWHSPDAGRTWAPFQNGLPDAPVFDLQVHPTQRLLRAATHGRGVFEIALE